MNILDKYSDMISELNVLNLNVNDVLAIKVDFSKHTVQEIESLYKDFRTILDDNIIILDKSIDLTVIKNKTKDEIIEEIQKN